MNKINYDKYLLFNDPIPYIANNLIEKYKVIEQEINNLVDSTKDLSIQQQEFNVLEEELNKNTLMFYPVTMADCLMFYTCIDCLLIDKNSIPNPKVISMSYLDYLFYIEQEDKTQYTYMKLKELLKMSLHLKDDDINFGYDEFNHVKIIINNIVYDKDDFEKFKEIICIQQGIELPNDDVPPDIRKALQEAQDFANKENKHPSTLEDQIDCVMIAIHEVDRQKIKKMPIRNFRRFYQRYDYKLQYTINKTAERSGMVKFDKPIEDWTNNFDRTFEERYSNVMLDAEAFTKKVKMEN